MQGLAGVETERLRLDPWDREVHADGLVRLNADPEVGGVPLSAEQSEAMSARLQAHWYARGYGLWPVDVKPPGAEEAEVPHPSRDERIKIMRRACSSS